MKDFVGEKFGFRVDEKKRTVQVIELSGEEWVLRDEPRIYPLPAIMIPRGSPTSGVGLWSLVWGILDRDNPIAANELRGLIASPH